MTRRPVEGPGNVPEALAPAGGNGPAAEALDRYLAAGLAPATRAAYADTWRRWCAWCEGAGVGPLAAPPEALAAWLASLAAGGLAPASVARHAAGVGAGYQAAGLPSPRSTTAVRAVLRGIRREHGAGQREAAPLRVEDLRAALPPASLRARDRRDRVVLLLGWAGAFRRSELVALDVLDVEERPEGLRVRLRRSKADGEGRGVDVGIPPGRDPDVCPVAAVRAWIELLPAGPGPLLRSVDRHGRIGASLGVAAIGRIVKEGARRARLDPSIFSAHSLRAGFATSAIEHGIPEGDVMPHTRHRSVKEFRRYVRRGSIFVANPAARMLS